MSTDNFPIETIPARLTTCPLQNNWKEFLCYLSFLVNHDSPIDRIEWKFLSPKAKDPCLGGSRSVTQAKINAKKMLLATLLPPDWEYGEMVVEVITSQNNYVCTWQVEAYQQPNNFILPLEGQVLILGGHRIGDVHRASWQIPSQQMAWDMLPLESDGLRLLNGKFTPELRAEDFSAFGKNVLAPAKGRVVKAVDGNSDLVKVGEYPKDINYYLEDLTRACGNYVIINHGDGIWSCLAHLRNGSVKVKAGDEIKIGEPVGELGNSGFSSGPHLHIHFMDSPDLLTASPLPIEFNIEGAKYAPQSGEIVSN